MSPAAPTPPSTRRRTRWGALLTSLVVMATGVGCRDARLDESDDGTATTVDGSFVPSGDGAQLTPGGAGPIASGESPLEGMRGARPGVTLPEAFRRKLLAKNPDLVDLGGAAEAYDTVVLLAIAAEAGRNDAPGRIAEHLIESSTVGTRCATYAHCDKAVLANEDIDYEGISGSIELLANGDPGVAGFAVVEFDGHGALVVDKEVEVQAQPLVDIPDTADPTAGPNGDGVLMIGTLLPVTGPSPTRAAAALAGAQVAVDEVNARGGVLGEPVVLMPDESGDGSTAATESAVQRLVEAGVDAVLGGTTFGIMSVALETLTEAGVVLISPTDTARALSVASDRGLFFRLAPPTDLEGQVLGTLISNDGYTRVAIVAGDGADDLELAADLTASVNAASGTVTATVAVSDQTDPGAAVDEALASDPQALVVVAGTPTAAAVIRALVDAGKGPISFPVYGTSANMGPDLARELGG